MSDYERCAQARDVLSDRMFSRNPFKKFKARNWVSVGIELLPTDNSEVRDFGVVVGSLVSVDGVSQLKFAESLLDKANLQEVPVRLQLASQPVHLD